MRNLFTFTALLLYLFTACSDRSVNELDIDKLKGQQSVFRMNSFGTDAEKFISFPVWFNDSIIKVNHIFKITRDFYSFDSDEANDFGSLNSEVPREKREYWFSENGQLKDLKVTYFYDDQEIGSVHYTYVSQKDHFGFAKVVVFSDTNTVIDIEEKDMDFPFKIHEKVKETSKYLAYRDQQTGDYLFFMLDKKYWGPLSVDSILEPTRNDIIVLGTSYYPVKKYQVSNKVNEKNVLQYSYNSKSRVLESIQKQDYPFDNKRSFTYNKKGFCTGYIDSTFTENVFLTRIISEVKTDKKMKPIKVVHTKKNQNNETGKIEVERISYEYKKTVY
ncbi:MAG: hypothetical protein RI922_1498 [Bacteroidota bacterium]|jgi:hypothetical protein